MGVLFFRLRRAKLAAPPLSSPPSSPVDFADLRRCTEGVLPTDPGVAAGAIEGVRPIEPGVRSARSDAIVASFVGGDAPSCGLRRRVEVVTLQDFANAEFLREPRLEIAQ